MPTAEAPPHVTFAYPSLPMAKDPAFNFYCVYLAGCRGPTPAIPQFVEEAPVVDVERPWEELGFTIPSNQAEQHASEHRKPRLKTKANGAPETERTRRWQHAFDKSVRLYEDPAHAAKGVHPQVIGTTLYCPLNETCGPNGTLEDHGPYAAMGSEGVSGMPMSGTPGVCPRCETEEQRFAALREIRDRYVWANVPLPAALTARIGAGGGK